MGDRAHVREPAKKRPRGQNRGQFQTIQVKPKKLRGDLTEVFVYSGRGVYQGKHLGRADCTAAPWIKPLPLSVCCSLARGQSGSRSVTTYVLEPLAAPLPAAPGGLLSATASAGAETAAAARMSLSRARAASINIHTRSRVDPAGAPDRPACARPVQLAWQFGPRQERDEKAPPERG